MALVLAIANPAAAPPGDLDPTFDGDGKVTTDFAGSADQANAVTIQGDGKIVTAGEAIVSGTLDFALARYNSDGSLDTTFDGDGKVTTDIASGSGDQAFSVAIQGDGKIVAAGSAVSGSYLFALARYNTDGSLDTTFSGDGKLTTDIAAGNDQARAVVIQGDGKIVAAGFGLHFGSTIGTADVAVVRYNTDGSLDPTFDGDGIVTTNFPSDNADQAFAVAIQGDGRIVVAGITCCAQSVDFALARYNADGSLDTTFDGDGLVTTHIVFNDQAFAVAIQGDGRIVAAGHAASGSTFDFGLARYNADGSLDTTFDADGKVTTDFAGSHDEALGVAIQGNGKIVAAGFAGIFPGDFALARYNADGSLDTTFSGDGKVTTDFAGGDDRAHAVPIQRDGKIVAAGFATVAAGRDFALARYTCFRRTSRPILNPLCP